MDAAPAPEPAGVEPEGRAIALFGATGRTGAWIGLRALRRGYRVRALRRPSSMDPLEGKPVEMLEGDVQNPDHAGRVIEGTSAVLVALGQRPPFSDVFCEAATAAILDAMRRHGVRRIITVTGAMLGVMDQGQSRLMRSVAGWFAAQQPAAAGDRAGQERVLMESDREWTIVKPCRLTGGPIRPRTKSGTHMRIGMLSRISRPNLAMFVLDQIDSTQYVRERVLVKA